MMKTVACSMVLGVALLATGCAHNPLVGDGGVRVDQFFGDVGLTGDGTNVTILAGSKVPKLSFIGNNNTVTIEDDVWVGKIEFWGKHNTVSVPEDLTFQTSQVGTNNQIVRRPQQGVKEPELYPEEYESEVVPDDETLPDAEWQELPADEAVGVAQDAEVREAPAEVEWEERPF